MKLNGVVFEFWTGVETSGFEHMERSNKHHREENVFFLERKIIHSAIKLHKMYLLSFGKGY